LAGQDRANDFRREIRETHEHRAALEMGCSVAAKSRPC
jgi:hypothetical protein